MKSLTYRQKVIIHLEKYKDVNPDDVFNMPWEITQDGIASALCISRAHASIELKKLEESDTVYERQAHVKEGKVRRRIYFLNESGLREAEEIKNYADANNIDLNTFIDKKQDIDAFMENMDDDCVHALGCASIFRVPVPIKLIPKSSKTVVPTNIAERTAITEGVRFKVLKNATPDMIREWHSYAADRWLDSWQDITDEDDMIHERLYHLVNAGRMIDASKHVSKYSYEILNTPNDDVTDIVQKIRYNDKYAKDVLITRMELDVEMRDATDLRETIELMKKYDEWLSQLYVASLEYVSGNRKKAIKSLEGMSNKDPIVNVRLAEIYYFENDLVKARELLNSTNGVIFSERPGLAVVKFILLARIDKKEGKDSDAYAHLMKAKASTPTDKGKKAIEDIVVSLDLIKFRSS